jgi:starch phosphorylase
MKFAMNGALTIGTLDGANIEIREEVGADNFFLFGMSTTEVQALNAAGHQPQRCIDADPELRGAIELIESGFFSRGDPEVFQPLLDNLRYHDPYLVLADFRAYADCQQRVSQAYRDLDGWTTKSILNTARSGYFSSDRTIREYCGDIWNVAPVSVPLLTPGLVRPGFIQ